MSIEVIAFIEIIAVIDAEKKRSAMPPRRRAESAAFLTADDLATLAAALASGKRATVYLRDPMPSLNLPAGASAKVVRIDGSTVVVAPRGIADELPFEPDELRLTKIVQTATPPPRKPAAPPSAAPAPARVEKPVAATLSVPSSPPADPPPPQPARKRAKRAAKKIEEGVLVTIHGGPEEAWTVSVAYGPRPPGKANPVKAEAVERAVAELDDAAARGAVDAVLSAARTAVTNRIVELNRQLEEARAALAALGSDD